MKILTLSNDKKILDPLTQVAERARWYGGISEQFTVVVPTEKTETIMLSPQVEVYGSGGKSKFEKISAVYRIAGQLLSKNAFDLISVQDPYFIGIVGAVLAGRFHVALEIQVHGFEKLSWLRKMIARYVLHKASGVRAVSERLKRQLVSEFSVPEKKITVVPIYSDIQKQEVAREKKTGPLIFLTVSRLVPVKNISLQIKVFAGILQTYPQSVLWIVGDGPEKAAFETQASALGIADQVKFFGWVNDVSEYYKKADVFMLTSSYEGWGMVIVEAASFGLPIIMTDVGCAGEFIKNGQNGIVIPLNDQEKLTEAMTQMIENPDRRIQIGTNAVNSLTKLLTKDQTLQLYKQGWQNALQYTQS